MGGSMRNFQDPGGRGCAKSDSGGKKKKAGRYPVPCRGSGEGGQHGGFFFLLGGAIKTVGGSEKAPEGYRKKRTKRIKYTDRTVL